MKKAGINGFGRFGMHLLQYWITHNTDAQFDIAYINDDHLGLKQVVDIIERDPYITLKESIKAENNALIITVGNRKARIEYTNEDLNDVPWFDDIDILLECSGKHTTKSDWESITDKGVEQIVISATSWTARQILVYGFNHTIFAANDRTISYGSCTVNAYVPLANWINSQWGIIESDVNVIHNVPVHKLLSFNTLERRSCTLENVAPSLLSFLTEDNFFVTYTLVPYDGVSIIDFRFRIRDVANITDIESSMTRAVSLGHLKGLYGIVDNDEGPEPHKFTDKSAILVKTGIRLVGDNLYLQAYFDNENSVNRYFDMVNYICSLKEK